MIILDTNVLSALMLDLPDPIVASWLDQESRTSVWTTTITIFEIRYGLFGMRAGRRRDRLTSLFERLIRDRLEQRILSFDAAAAAEAAAVMVSRERIGRPRDFRDTMIAGIALAQNATLATRNVKHFDDLRVPVVDPWQA